MQKKATSSNMLLKNVAIRGFLCQKVNLSQSDIFEFSNKNSDSLRYLQGPHRVSLCVLIKTSLRKDVHPPSFDQPRVQIGVTSSRIENYNSGVDVKSESRSVL